MGKKPLSKEQVAALRVLTQNKPLQALLLNLSVDLMLRASDLLGLKVKEVLTPSGEVRETVRVRQRKSSEETIEMPLSFDSRDAILRHLLGRPPEDCIFAGQKYETARKPICTQTFARIIKNWMRELGIEDVRQYSTHSLRRTKPSIIYEKTGNLEAVRRLLGHSNLIDTVRYLGVEDADATELARSVEV